MIWMLLPFTTKTCGAGGLEPLLVLDQSGILDLHSQTGHAVIGVQDVLCTAQSFHDMGCGLCIVCAGSSLFGCAAANLLLDGSCVCGKVGDFFAVLTAGGS